MRVTLDDIAARSGVSKTTVSYILNDKQTAMGISAGTISKVRDVMAALNYAPNHAAVALGRRRKPKATVLILTPWLSAANSHFMTEVSKAAEKHKRVVNVDYRMFTPGEVRLVLNDKKLPGTDRILIMGTNGKDEDFLRTFSGKEKLFLLNRTVEGIACFTSSNARGGGLVAEHALRSSSYGAYLILSPRKPSQALRERIAGIAGYFDTVGLRRPRTIHIDEWDEVELRRVVDAHRGVKPLFFTLQDSYAIQLASCLRAMGMDVPREAGVTGYDNDPVTAVVRPGITTIDSRTLEVAGKAFEFMLSGKRESMTIEPVLVVRESTNYRVRT